jgi:hypothetical protein
MKACPMCQVRPVPPDFHTCGNSSCQEAGFYENRVQKFRKGSTARETAIKLFQAKKDIAQERVR